jgi:Bacitracin resistance protein BacA
MHPISYIQAIVLGLVQGAAELFPVSSLGHSVILPRLLGWDIHQDDDYFLTFLVATHLATALVLLGFFRQDWVRIARGLGRSLRDRGIAADDNDARLGWLLVLGTIPAGLLGLALEHPLRKVGGGRACSRPIITGGTAVGQQRGSGPALNGGRSAGPDAACFAVLDYSEPVSTDASTWSLSALASWVRDVTSSLLNTLRRW